MRTTAEKNLENLGYFSLQKGPSFPSEKGRLDVCYNCVLLR